jgi:YHS domain-containing protein
MNPRRAEHRSSAPPPRQKDDPMHHRLPAVAILSALLAGAAPAGSDPPPGDPPPGADHASPRDTSHYNLEKGAPAIQGYDPVAYFPEGGGKAKKGTKEHAHVHREVTYWFASHENQRRFIENPDRYEPAYGGWCASAMADGGRKVEIDPKNFKVTNGRLFLFYKSLFQDAIDFWNKDEPGHTREADTAWMKLTGEAPRAG